MLRLAQNARRVAPRSLLRPYKTLAAYQLNAQMAGDVHYAKPANVASLILEPIKALPPNKPEVLRVFQSPEFALNAYHQFHPEHPIPELRADGMAPIDVTHFLEIASSLAEDLSHMENGNALCLSAAVKFKPNDENANPRACSIALLVTSGKDQVIFIQIKETHSRLDGFTYKVLDGAPIQLIKIPDSEQAKNDLTAAMLQCLDFSNEAIDGDKTASRDLTFHPSMFGDIDTSRATKTSGIVIASEGSASLMGAKSGIWTMTGASDEIFTEPTTVPEDSLYRFLGPTLHRFFYGDNTPQPGRYTRITIPKQGGNLDLLDLGSVPLPQPKPQEQDSVKPPPRTVKEAWERASSHDLRMQIPQMHPSSTGNHR